mmetsp:Transcript_123275/g.343233  ORF Transcript_123275/g.343233 Transcript_123275/m.343233 type:complete len:242 (+) Transcript_123275:345-1070(+)
MLELLSVCSQMVVLLLRRALREQRGEQRRHCCLLEISHTRAAAQEHAAHGFMACVRGHNQWRPILCVDYIYGRAVRKQQFADFRMTNAGRNVQGRVVPAVELVHGGTLRQELLHDRHRAALACGMQKRTTPKVRTRDGHGLAEQSLEPLCVARQRSLHQGIPTVGLIRFALPLLAPASDSVQDEAEDKEIQDVTQGGAASSGRQGGRLLAPDLRFLCGLLRNGGGEDLRGLLGKVAAQALC